MILTRRKFLGAFVAAPAVILTPGLLMPVRSFNRNPLYDICDLLSQTNDILSKMTFVEQPFTTVVRTCLPIVTWRHLNDPIVFRPRETLTAVTITPQIGETRGQAIRRTLLEKPIL